jgi:glycosyltransferase involved in cell wall biosynthesis
LNKKIKILHVSTSFGTSSAGYRLHKSLLKETDADSYCFVQSSSLDDMRIVKLSDGILSKIKLKIFSKIENILINTFYPNRLNLPFSSASFSSKNVVKQINNIKPDIVHLHWICGGFMKIEDIAKIKPPIVWSLHDQWGYTGGCHIVAEQAPQHSGKWMPHCCYDLDRMCNKYTQNCKNCGVLRSTKEKDLSFRILQRKKKVFGKIKSMVIVGVSRWMADCAKKSTVFSNKKVICLPNPIDTNVFKPVDKFQSRMLWNLPKDKKLVLFGAIAATSTSYKGYDSLAEALNKISSENVEFVIFGSSEPTNPPKLPCKVHYLGHLYDNVSLVSLYSACDVMVVPSKRESFGQTASEAFSCGTPVVAFGIGGLTDIIDHKINGYLAQPFDTSDLAKGIDWILNSENYDELSKNAREKVVREFDYGVVAPKCINLYEEVLRNS